MYTVSGDWTSYTLPFPLPTGHSKMKGAVSVSSVTPFPEVSVQTRKSGSPSMGSLTMMLSSSSPGRSKTMGSASDVVVSADAMSVRARFLISGSSSMKQMVAGIDLVVWDRSALGTSKHGAPGLRCAAGVSEIAGVGDLAEEGGDIEEIEVPVVVEVGAGVCVAEVLEEE